MRMVVKLFFFMLSAVIIATFVFTAHRDAGASVAQLASFASRFSDASISLKFKRSLTEHKSDPKPKDLQRRLPKALIIGVKKAGTRALLEYLRLHPSVRAPGPEVHFFDRYFDRGLEWYRRQMSQSLPEQLTIEKTPSYFVARDVPSRVYNLNPQMKLILVVRDPVTRALSDYSQNAAKTNMGPLESYAFTNNSRCEVNPHWGAIRLGLYWKHFRKWLEHFPLKNFLIVSGERLITHPAEEMRLVESFLNLSPVINEDHFYFNATKGFPCLKKAESSGRPKCLGKTKGRRHPVISRAALFCLRTFFEPHNRIFTKLTGKKFTWSNGWSNR